MVSLASSIATCSRAIFPAAVVGLLGHGPAHSVAGVLHDLVEREHVAVDVFDLDPEPCQSLPSSR